MSTEEAQAYHATQIDILSKTNTDMVSALTMIYPEEAIGIARAAKAVGMSVVISFTLETNGRLSTRQTLKEVIELVDEGTECAPTYYMVNCMHPSHLEHVLVPDGAWTDGIHGMKGNSSKKRHAELNECKELGEGNPVEFGEHSLALLNKLKHLNIIGGCCETNHHHIEEICKACISVFNKLKHGNYGQNQKSTSLKK